MQEKQVKKNIISAATAVFVEKGKDGARMQEIADRAGVNKMLLHYYFKDKETLFYEVLKETVADLYGSVFNGNLETPTFKEFLSAFIHRHFVFLNEKKDTFQFLLWELSRKRYDLRDLVAGMNDRYGKNPFDILSFKLNEAVGKGEIRPIDTTGFILNLFSLDLSVFVALPVIREIVPMDEGRLADAIDRREKEIFRLLWNDIQKD